MGWYENEPFYTAGALRPGWRLRTKDVVPGSRGKNYLDQTDVLCDYLINSVFAGMEMPKIVMEAIEEFRSQKKELAKLLDKDWQEVAKRLVALKINQLFRESPVEALWSLSLYERVNHERLLHGVYTWTNELSSGGYVVSVGCFGVRGVSVDYGAPGYSYGSLGFCFSRSA